MGQPEQNGPILETYSLPKLNQEESENMNRQITVSKIGAIIFLKATNESPVPDGFTGEFYQTFQEELTLLFLKLPQKIQAYFTNPALSKLQYQKQTLQEKKIIGQYP